jgi:DNA polymerase-3 subunit chi
VPPFFSRFHRVAELVDGDEEQRRQSRERYRFYRDRGYALENHPIKAEQYAREG